MSTVKKESALAFKGKCGNNNYKTVSVEMVNGYGTSITN